MDFSSLALPKNCYGPGRCARAKEFGEIAAGASKFPLLAWRRCTGPGGDVPVLAHTNALKAFKIGKEHEGRR